MNLTLTLVHKTNKLYYIGDDPSYVAWKPQRDSA